jgi:pimeloyl-ACP methyl ester carboxylesterase
VAGYAAASPESIRRVILIAPAGLSRENHPVWAACLMLPILGEIIFGLFARSLLLRELEADFHQPIDLPQYRAKYKAQMRFRGFQRALLSTIRSGILGRSQAVLGALGTSELPVLLIWGEKDRTVPFELHKHILALIPKAEFHAIKAAAHLPHIEQPQQTHEIMLKFLAS